MATAKFVFQHPQYGIVSVRDPVRLVEAQRYGLNPLLLYGLTAAGLPIRWMSFSPQDNPKPLRQVLLSAWKQADRLRGLPDALVVSRQLAQADLSLGTDLAQIGVALEIAGPREKSLPASLRTTQEESRWVSGKSKSQSMSAADAITTFCADAELYHASRTMVPRRDDDKGKGGIKDWLALPFRNPDQAFDTDDGWKPGPWLSSWEASIPPERDRYFSFSAIERRTWLHGGQEPRVEANEIDAESEGYDNAAEIAKLVVECWPNPVREIARSIGTTLKELNWFLAGQSQLARSTRFNLINLLSVEFDDDLNSYAAKGPYALIARKASALKAWYLDISGGGDACPCEVIPSMGLADPSWRYVLINPHSQPPSIVMVARGDRIGDQLTDLILNFEGARRVDLGLYRDVVSTCARASLSPDANARAMADFSDRHKGGWNDRVWLPGDDDSVVCR